MRLPRKEIIESIIDYINNYSNDYNESIDSFIEELEEIRLEYIKNEQENKRGMI